MKYQVKTIEGEVTIIKDDLLTFRPIQYNNGAIAYDFQVPAYVERLVKKEYRKKELTR